MRKNVFRLQRLRQQLGTLPEPSSKTVLVAVDEQEPVSAHHRENAACFESEVKQLCYEGKESLLVLAQDVQVRKQERAFASLISADWMAGEAGLCLCEMLQSCRSQQPTTTNYSIRKCVFAHFEYSRRSAARTDSGN